MKTARNALFAIAVSLLLCCVLANLAAALLPGGSRPGKSALENRSYQSLPYPTAKSLTSGEFQESFDRYMSDAAPSRDAILLANAAAQRTIIRTANAPLGYEAYPTFFGSSRIVNDKLGTVYRSPSNAETYSQDFMSKVSNFCNSITSGFDEIRWAYYLPATSNISRGNPAWLLCSSELDYDAICNQLDASIDKCPILRQAGNEQTDLYVNQGFHTDHHFQIQGAILEYQTICREFDRSPISLGEPYVVFNGRFFGSNARAGLINAYSDVIYDVPYANNHISCKFNGSEKGLAGVDKLFLSDKEKIEEPAPFSNEYTWWFHGHQKLIEYENPDLDESAGSLLIIGDSYINSSDRFYAENWKRVYIVDARKYGDVNDIRTFIEQHNDISNAVIALALTTYPQIGSFNK